MLKIAYFLTWNALVCSVQAQAAGSFLIPSLRAGGGTEFAYWNSFGTPAGSSYNYNFANPPALLNGGRDAAGNITTLTTAGLLQTGTPTCFVTSTGALYSFAAATAFQVTYPSPGSANVTNVIFQTQTGGRRFDINNIRLNFIDGNGNASSLAPRYKALDDPQTGAFSERLVSAFQWDLTDQGVGSFSLNFSAPGSSMPLWEAQLDVVRNEPFVRQLGYLLLPESIPRARFGRVGRITYGSQSGFFNPGQTATLSAIPELGWAHTGWDFQDTLSTNAQFPVTFADGDLAIKALFAPESYSAWRNSMFLHSNSLLGQGPDNNDPLFSGPEADPDGDGVKNYAEYAFGGDPYLSDAARTAPSCVLIPVGGQLFPALQYVEATAGFRETYYRVQLSPNLTTWQDDAVVEHSRALQANGTSLVVARSLQSLNSLGKQFLRVIAE